MPPKVSNTFGRSVMCITCAQRGDPFEGIPLNVKPTPEHPFLPLERPEISLTISLARSVSLQYCSTAREDGVIKPNLEPNSDHKDYFFSIETNQGFRSTILQSRICGIFVLRVVQRTHGVSRPVTLNCLR